MKKQIFILLSFTVVFFLAHLSGAWVKKETADAPQKKANAAAAQVVIWIGGDSLSTEIGSSLYHHFLKTNRVIVKRFHQGSSGFARFDYFAWPKHIERQMNIHQPNLIIFMIGANDTQNLVINNKSWHLFGTEKWRKEYSQRVGQAMDLLGKQEKLVFWMGLPAMKEKVFHQKTMVLNQIYAQEAAKRPFIKFLPTDSYLVDAQFRYADFLPGARGGKQRVRATDGIHLYPAGARRIIPVVLNELNALYPVVAAYNISRK